MKICPQCRRSYADELSYCLSDGTPLADEPTLEPEEPTVVRPTPVRREKTKTGLIVLSVLAVILTLALGATIGILYVFWPRQQVAQQTPANGASASPSSTPQKSPPATPSPTSTRPTTPTPAATETPDSSSAEDESEPDSDRPDPPTSRISFRRGRSDETLSGTIGRRRSFVLYARGGQTLKATVRSDN